MFDHITINVSDYAKSKTFYEAVLGALGMTAMHEIANEACGFGKERPQFWIGQADAAHTHTVTHIAFACTSENYVQRFYDAAIAAGARDNGKPGPRPEYDENYYAAFVHDFDGNNIEAVFRG